MQVRVSVGLGVGKVYVLATVTVLESVLETQLLVVLAIVVVQFYAQDLACHVQAAARDFRAFKVHVVASVLSPF